MKRAFAMSLLPALLGFGAVGGCAYHDMMDEDEDIGRRVPVEFVDPDGDRVGSAILDPTPNGVLIDVELRDLEQGWHGFHIHQAGRCDTPGFESAGDHYNPGSDAHGYAASDGPHAGDLPNIYVHEDGTAAFQIFTPHLSLNPAGELFDADGAAIVIHSGPDNYESQPSGDSGDRIACAVIEQ